MYTQMYKKNSDKEALRDKFSVFDYMLSVGCTPVAVKNNYALFHAPYRQDRNPSCVVYRNENIFVDKSTGQKGDIFTLVQLIHNCSFKDSLSILSADSIISIPQEKYTSYSSDYRIKILEVKAIESCYLKKYIISRGITPNLASKYCREISYSVGDKEYYAIGFGNDAGGWELRNAYFKSSSKNYITTIQELPEFNQNFAVFEGFFDFLSHKQVNCNRPMNAIVLNSASNVNKCIEKLKEFDVKQVFVFADADDAGEKVFSKIQEVYNDKAIDMSAEYRLANCKDLNELLLKKTLKK